MQQSPIRKPSLGRTVLFTQSTVAPSSGFVAGRDYAAVVVEVDEAAGVLVLHVKTTDPERPVRVAIVPYQQDVVDAWGCSWRPPPHV